MTDLPIYSHTDLRNEIYRLQGLEREKGAALKERFSSPGAIFSTFFSLFKSGDQVGDKDGGIFQQDFLGVISRFIIPFTLNKTLFRNSNFLVKALVGLVSQKASHFVSEDSVEGIWDKAKGLFGKAEGLFGKAVHLFEKSPKKKKPDNVSFKKIKKD